MRIAKAARSRNRARACRSARKQPYAPTPPAAARARNAQTIQAPYGNVSLCIDFPALNSEGQPPGAVCEVQIRQEFHRSPGGANRRSPGSRFFSVASAVKNFHCNGRIDFNAKIWGEVAAMRPPWPCRPSPTWRRADRHPRLPAIRVWQAPQAPRGLLALRAPRHRRHGRIHRKTKCVAHSRAPPFLSGSTDTVLLDVPKVSQSPAPITPKSRRRKR